MACVFCGVVNCGGGCRLVPVNPGQLVASYPSYPINPLTGMTTPFIPMDTSLTNFLSILEDKTDTDACIAFIEQQRQIHKRQLEEIEQLKKQFEENLAQAEKEFISKCLKYRPTITLEMMERVKSLKAFY